MLMIKEADGWTESINEGCTWKSVCMYVHYHVQRGKGAPQLSASL
jgi:hypothetical protein